MSAVQRGTIPRPACVVDRGAQAELQVVVVTYNSGALMDRWLLSLPEALRGVRTVQVTVVDNASSDGTVQLLRNRAPWVEVHAMQGNLGYAAGINVALRRSAASRGVLVLNPDAVPSPDCAARLLSALDRPGTGITVPRVIDDCGGLKFSLRREPTLLRALGEATMGGHRAARFRRFGDMVREPSSYTDGATADWATGAAMCIGRRTMDEVGLWDERFFLYSEETEYCLRARDRGLAVSYVSDATVAHPGGDMEVDGYLWSLVALNRVRLYRMRHGAAAAAVYWLTAVMNEATRAALGRPTNREALRVLLRHPPTGATARMDRTSRMAQRA